MPGRGWLETGSGCYPAPCFSFLQEGTGRFSDIRENSVDLPQGPCLQRAPSGDRRLQDEMCGSVRSEFLITPGEPAE